MMNKPLDAIVYPGSDQYSAEELAAPGSVPVELHAEPLVRVVDTAYIMFEVPDLAKQGAFLQDFGLLEAAQTDSTLYMRGYGTAPYIYLARKGDSARFLGAGFLVGSEEELQRVASETGNSIESVDGPGGGKRVRLTDPDGFLVDIVHGREQVPALETRRDALPVNLPNKKERVNRGQRTPLAASAVERFGHYVLMVSDLEASWKWYRRHLGLLPTDVLCTAVGMPALAFTRLDKGEEPADHHTVVLAAGPSAAYMHSAYETLDQDAIGQGQQYLKLKGWKHFWGMGRHILGSQIFDYWLDPHGFEVEHYADGDVFDNSYPTQYHLADRGGLWAWGADLPPAMKPRATFKDILKVIFSSGDKKKRLLGMKQAMDRAPRPWLK
ncbi:MAG: glyoxalase [Haliea sp.]|jgi:catechol 2,3-dioxygenase-like lactoylglutathione lyase family enzyme|nr:glyoxalase [Haliea sp.]